MFIRLKLNNGDSVYINTDKIALVYENKEFSNVGSNVSINGYSVIYVKETPDEIIEKIREAETWRILYGHT